MATTLHRGTAIQLSGDLPVVGQAAPNFRFVLADLAEGELNDLSGKIKVLMCMPSLDTSTCALETKTFNKKLEGIEGLEALVITNDLPFAMRRFCETEGIVNVRSASDFRYHDFSQYYGVQLCGGLLKGLHARAVFVIDAQNVIRYTELVPNVSEEPNYDAVLKAVNQLR